MKRALVCWDYLLSDGRGNYSDMIEVPSEHDSGCDLDDNLYLHFNYSIQKKEFLESKMGERKSKMGNGKSKIWVDLLSKKRKAK